MIRTASVRSFVLSALVACLCAAPLAAPLSAHAAADAAPDTAAVANTADETAQNGEEEAASEGAAKKPAAPKIQLFGTVEVRRPVKTLPVWLQVLQKNEANPIFTPGSRLNASTTWDELKARAKGLSRLDTLKLVNKFWNQWPYREDREAYGQPDYWAAPYEFRKTSGDCEDYSIAKYFTLKELGFSTDEMRVVVVMETIRNIAHAVLVVYLDGEAYVLDNLSANVLPHSRLRNYLPQYSVNEKYRWSHMKPKKQPTSKRAKK